MRQESRRRAPRTLTCLGAVALAGLASTARADDAPSTREMAAQIQALRQEVSQLRSERGESWMNQRRAEEVKALVREVLEDADNRASLQGGGLTAGWDKKFFLASPDRSFLMNVGGRIQARYIYNDRDPVSAASTDPNEGGFQLRRVKLQLDGYVANPKIGYKVVFATNRNNTLAYLDEALVSYALADGLTLSAGRTKAPFLKEELVSAGRQLAVERSELNENFTAGFTEGVMLSYGTGLFRITGMINDGQNEAEGPQVNGSFTYPAGAYPAGTSQSVSNTGTTDFSSDAVDLAATLRAELRLTGDWKQGEDFAAWSGEEMALILGAAAHFELAETGTGSAGGNDRFVMYTVDGQFEYQGFNLFAAFIGRSFDDEDRAGQNNLDQWGFLVQAGYMVIPDTLEPFARFEYMDGDGAQPGNQTLITTANVTGDLLRVVTIGANYYLRKHDAKFTVDWLYHLDRVARAHSGLGVLADDNNKDGQWLLRLQFQVQF